MSIGTIPTVAGGQSAPATALPTVSSEIRAVLTQIATAPGLQESERAALVQVTATASSIADAQLRAVALRQVSSMGMYFSRTGDSGLPRWTVMTALRAYGLNIQQNATQATSHQSAEIANSVARQVSTLAASRGVSLSQALQSAPQAQAIPTPIQLKNAAVVNLGGLKTPSADTSAADLTTQLLNTLV
jgi:hypothetical protein